MTKKEAAIILLPLKNDQQHNAEIADNDVAKSVYKLYVEALTIAINTLNKGN